VAKYAIVSVQGGGIVGIKIFSSFMSSRRCFIDCVRVAARFAHFQVLAVIKRVCKF
jgi:hypothetical protein